MTVLLPVVGTTSYNGFTFPLKTMTVGIDGNPIFDVSGRTIIYNTWAITLKTWLGIPDDAADDAAMVTLMESAKDRLMAPGGELRYTNKGFGNLEINVSDVRDVVWGPKPRAFHWRPTGSNQQVEITWTVEVAIPQCAGATYEFALMEVNYRATFDIDQSGYTTRGYTGHLRIPLTRSSQSDRTLSDTADQYRDNIMPEIPEGFRRVKRRFTIDESKTRLDFDIVDTEMPPNALPPNVIEAHVSHVVENDEARNMVMWRGTFHGIYEMARGTPTSAAWEPFFKTVTSRIAVTRSRAVNYQGTLQVGVSIIPLHLSLREPDIYGKGIAEFTFSYTFTTELQSILRACALWIPVDDTHSAWKSSVETAMGSRGNANLGINPGDDVIIDLCVGGDLTVQPTPSNLVGDAFEALDFLQVTPPSPDSSWLAYECHLAIETEDTTVEHKPLLNAAPEPAPTAGQETGDVSPGDFLNADADIMLKIDAPTVSYSGTQPNITQTVGNPTFYAILTGKALRAGYPIPIPALTQVGGVQIKEANRAGDGFKQWIIADLGIPIVAATWRLRYLLTQAPNVGIGVPGNPLMRG